MTLRKLLCCAIMCGSPTLYSSAAHAASSTADGLTIANNHPRFAAAARKIGPVDPTIQMEVSIWLKPHNKADLDFVAKDLYDSKSANYRHWLTRTEFAHRYAPTATEAQSVRNFFAANGLKTISTGPNNFYVRASGTAAAVTKAFRVSLNNYEVNGKVMRGNAQDPFIAGKAAPVVASVSGLDNMEYARPVSKKGSIASSAPSTLSQDSSKAAARKAFGETQASAAATVAAAAAVTSLPFNSRCLVGQTTQTFTTNGSLPIATYSGNEYTPATAGCGYTPENIQTAYKLKSLYAEGFDGKGQTVVIIDWCGSPTVTSDSNDFSARFGLPKLTASNFKIIYTPTPSHCSSPNAEINLDVQWVHAVAPGAKIALVVPPSATFQDVDQGLFYAVNYGLGNVISGSFGSEELYTSDSVLFTEAFITETAAVLGISANFSSGDDGDFTYDLPEYYSASVSAPASSPYATAIGGVSALLNPNGTLAYQLGWGTNENVLADEGFVTDPPGGNAFFEFGSGGGPSGFFNKPAFQSKLPGQTRQLPDVSWLADPYTGVYIAISEPGVLPTLQYEVIGGTSLACPMFSALWAIANQAAGVPLGQAAPYLYSMPASTITDIVPIGFNTNVKGTVTNDSGKTFYTAQQLAQPLEGSNTFVNALWDYPLYQDTAILLTFGTDSGLKVTRGWDNVTGLGVPNPKAFADYFKP